MSSSDRCIASLVPILLLLTTNVNFVPVIIDGRSENPVRQRMLEECLASFQFWDRFCPDTAYIFIDHFKLECQLIKQAAACYMQFA